MRLLKVFKVFNVFNVFKVFNVKLIQTYLLSYPFQCFALNIGLFKLTYLLTYSHTQILEMLSHLKNSIRSLPFTLICLFMICNKKTPDPQKLGLPNLIQSHSFLRIFFQINLFIVQFV